MFIRDKEKGIETLRMNKANWSLNLILGVSLDRKILFYEANRKLTQTGPFPQLRKYGRNTNIPFPIENK